MNARPNSVYGARAARIRRARLHDPTVKGARCRLSSCGTQLTISSTRLAGVRVLLSVPARSGGWLRAEEDDDEDDLFGEDDLGFDDIDEDDEDDDEEIGDSTTTTTSTSSTRIDDDEV